MTDYHLSRCPKLIVTCSNAGCEMKMTREDVEDHRKKTCSYQPILCKYNSLGCMFMILRKEEEHILWNHEADISGHLEMAVKNPGSPSITSNFLPTVVHKSVNHSTCTITNCALRLTIPRKNSKST